MKDHAGEKQMMTGASFATPTCPLTGAALSPARPLPMDWRRPSDPRQWSIWWTPDHRFGQIQPRPTPEQVGAFYEVETYYTHVARSEIRAEEESLRPGRLQKILGSIAWRFEHGAEPTSEWWRSVIPQGAREGLEIGCGNGDRMLTIAPHVGRVIGVEPDPAAAKVARGNGLDVREGTAEDLPEAVKDRRYDAIVFAHVLEHTIDPVLALKNAGDLLTDTGVMSVEVPNNACTGAAMMGDCWRWLDVPRHLNFFTPQSLRACAEAAGLTVQAVLYRGYVRQFMPDWILDEARIVATMEGRAVTQADVNRQVRHSAQLLARTAFAAPERKYDSVRVLCTRA